MSADKLLPDSRYKFRLLGSNRDGKGEATTVVETMNGPSEGSCRVRPPLIFFSLLILPRCSRAVKQKEKEKTPFSPLQGFLRRFDPRMRRLRPGGPRPGDGGHRILLRLLVLGRAARLLLLVLQRSDRRGGALPGGGGGRRRGRANDTVGEQFSPPFRYKFSVFSGFTERQSFCGKFLGQAFEVANF